MATNNVFVSTSGSFYEITDNTLEITAANQVLDPSDVKVFGLISEEGYTVTPNRTLNAIRAFQYGAVARQTITEQSVQVEVNLLESSDEVLELYYGSGFTGGKLNWDLSKLYSGRFGFDVFDSSFGSTSEGSQIRTERLILPSAYVAEVGPLTTTFGGARVYTVTLQNDPDPLTGVSAQIFRSVITPSS